MRANEFVTELFEPGKPWQWSFQGSEEAVAVFHVGEVPYMFHAYGSDGEWEAEFKRHGSKLDRSQKFGLTGTGNSAEVMSTVVDIMRAFLEKYKDKIQVLTFSAKEDSRQGLYARMIKRLLPDWTMQQKDEFFTLFAPKQNVAESLQPNAAGCIIVAEDTGRWCLQQRSDAVSDPGLWSTWGGGREPGESLEQCVRRELAEEGGYTGPLKLEPLMMNQRYATYIGHVPHEFDPQINNEVKDWCWVEPDDLPNPLHAGLEQALSKLNENFADGKVKGTELKNSIPTGLYFDIDDVSVNQLYRGLGIGALLYKLVITCIARLNPKVKGLLSPRKNRLSTATNVSKIYSQLGGKVGINGAKDIYDLLPIKNYITLEVEPQPGAQIAAISGKNISFLVDEAGPYRVVLTVFDHNTMKPIGFISATASFWDSETETLDNENISENFADGKVKGKSRPGRVKRSGASCNGSVSSLRAKARKYGGERGKMYHWCANMKGGKKK